MLKKNIFILIGVFLALSGGFVFFILKSEVKTASIKGKTLSLEIADTNDKKERGLGGRDNLCENCAMLFIFSEKYTPAFWMKDMRFDLDIIWVRKGRIVYIAKNVSRNLSENAVSLRIEADKVLEVNAGLSDKYGFEAGDEVDFKK
ncbi:MAG TPA: DUF192 domain-containing protein [Candidatus Moranbacteria bacterium]|nr:DUF192 domain-containing protein [Candidatus Moranbacteria bacterium]